MVLTAAEATPADRGRWLVAAADALDAAADELVPLAHAETHLPATPRLAGELKRTTFQLRLFAVCILASAVSAIPCVSLAGCCCLGQGVGIWSILVLLSSEVRAAFR